MLRPRRWAAFLPVLLVSTVLSVVTLSAPATAAPCDAPVTNPVACENTLPGSPESEWGITGAGSSTIQGFATDMSVDQGQTVDFKVDTVASSYRLDIYRMGYYNGAGARKVATVTPTVLNNQPACLTDSTTGLVDCGNWTRNAQWAVPSTAVSGIYFAKLVRTDGTAGASHVFFVVRDDDGGSDMLFQTSDTTWQAYNTYGGNSLYSGAPVGRAYKVSYNRPFTTRANAPEDWVFNSEYPMVRYLESNGYNVSYSSGIDTDRRGAELLEHNVFLSVGHDEYWSGPQRTNVEAARAAGVNLAFFSGNEVFWKSRWENSIDGSGTPYRTLVSYKETHANAKSDPLPNTWTGTWRDPRFSPPADGGRPENALTGTMFSINCCAVNMVVGQADGRMRFWRNTRVATLGTNATTTIGSNVIGYEWDEDVDNASRPAGLFRLSQTTASGDKLQDYGSTYAQGSATHAMTLYRHASGALVFGAGTIQWPWALDSSHDRGSAAADTAAQQATVNLFADMGVQPSTLRPGLVAATASTDTTAPTSTITAPAAGATLTPGNPVTISGTATDAGGGRVGGVEVSTDNGTTWRRATGRESWTYSWTPSTNGQATLRTRAVDDSANLETPGAGRTVTVGSGTTPATCPCTIWPDSATPAGTDPDRDAVELGVRFRSSTDGLITGIRYYRPTEATGTHVGSLWSNTGTRLANVTFPAGTASGWQQADFAQPVAVTAGTTYVASYFTPSRYVVNGRYFRDAPTTRGPLTALQDGTDGGNGVYRYTTTAGVFPNSASNGENYWVDVVFSNAPDTAKPTVTDRSPASGATGVGLNANVTATFSEPVQQGSITAELRGPGGTLVPAATAYDGTSRTVTVDPTDALAATTTYTATVSGARDTAGNQMDPVSWSFTTGTPDTTKPTLTGRTPAPGATSALGTTNVTATFSEAVQASTIAVELRTSGGALVAGATAYDGPTRTVTLDPTATLAGGATYTATVSGARDDAGNQMDPVSWSFTTAQSAWNCPCTIWPDSTTPAGTDPDTSPVELGVRFRASTDGFITGIRYWRPAVSTGTHVGSLWSNTGTRLANVTFPAGTASGWQQADFAQPVAVTAGTTYVASYFTPSRYVVNGRYFRDAPTTRGPLTALQDGTDGGNGVYRYTSTAGVFPSSASNGENYWVDVVFSDVGGTDTQKPTVTDRSPASGATGVGLNANVTATFSEPVQQGSITAELRGPGGTLVPAATAYDGTSRTVTVDPTDALAATTTYTATVSGARDTAGNQMDPLTWTFTTGSGASLGCPCTIWPATATPATSEPDPSPVEVGVKFRASADGFVTGIRYYKPSGYTGTRIGSLFSRTGTKLASVTFSGDTASGWQQASFDSPVPVTAGTTYVASYYTTAGYALSTGYFTSAATTRGPLTALQTGTDGGNGVYRYSGTAGTFPDQTFNAANYWVDVVFAENATDTAPPTVTGRVPASGAVGVPVTVRPSATFSEAVTGSSVSMVLRTSGGTQVASSTSYDAATRTATLAPTSALSPSTDYTVTVSGATDPSGNQMVASSWSFQTAAPPPPGVDEGPGGPIAVVTSAANPSSSYLTEILRAEGLNEFANLRIGNLTTDNLASYSVVVLGDVALTDAQVTALTTWVNGGGNLIAMRPDARLYPLAGITAQTGTVAQGYLAVNAASEAGAGITTATMQFHGTANRYSLNGASSVATLYTTATASTGLPAVTVRSVGSSGGQVATFAYDLARSVIGTRQGNSAWAGQERDGQTPIRPDDMFFGGSSTDWVNLSKVHIPQADEQQRLLANLITTTARDRMPVPRFWYFPKTAKAVVVGTGDDHGNGGTSGRFDIYASASPAGCSVTQWECPRFTSYVYPSTPLSDAQAKAYHDAGFEVGLHPQNNCANFTTTSLQQTYTSQLGTWASRFGSLPSPVSSRFHCMVFSDWASQPKVELASGIRMDTNYYYWPGSWIANRPGFMNGSGMPMRFTDTDGSMIDVFQTQTVMTDESGQSYPFTPNTLLDRALGAEGYYGAFTTNLHTDSPSTYENTQVLQSAQSRGVPVITARQLLTWTDGRNASSFTDLSWSGSALSFGIGVGSGATNLTAMLPTTGPGGRALSSITRGGTQVAYTTMTVKGQQYAVFPALGGAHVATYGTSGTATVTTASTTEVTSDGATLAWKSEAPGSTVVALGTTADSLSTEVQVAGQTTDHLATLDGLAPATRYLYRVRTRGADGTTSVWPAADRPPATFTTAARDGRAPTIRDVRALALPDGTARVTWKTDEPATSTVRFGRTGGRLSGLGFDDTLTRRHTVVITGLRPRRDYALRIGSRDATGNAAAVRAQRLRTRAAGLAMYTAPEFRTGTSTGGLTIDEAGLGSLVLRGRTGTYTSRVVDSGRMARWTRLLLDASAPEGARVVVRVRAGMSPTPDDTWSQWTTATRSGRLGLTGRMLQYSVYLVRGSTQAPVRVRVVGFERTGPLVASEED